MKAHGEVPGLGEQTPLDPKTNDGQNVSQSERRKGEKFGKFKLNK